MALLYSDLQNTHMLGHVQHFYYIAYGMHRLA
jgi:hypothetical protein